MSYHYADCPRCRVAFAGTRGGAFVCSRCEKEAWEEKHDIMDAEEIRKAVETYQRDWGKFDAYTHRTTHGALSLGEFFEIYDMLRHCEEIGVEPDSTPELR